MLVLVAIGLAITFGVMGVINMAHGELMMLGAYTTYVVQLLMPEYIGRVDPGGHSRRVPGGRRWRAWCSSARSSGFSTAGRSRRCWRPSASACAAAAGALGLLGQQPRGRRRPPWMSGTLQINEALALTFNRLYIVVFTLIVFAILLAGAQAHAARPRHPGRGAEPRDGARHGHPQRLGGRDDVRPRLRDCRRGRRGAEPADQRRSQPRAVATSSTRSWWSSSAASAISGAR